MNFVTKMSCVEIIFLEVIILNVFSPVLKVFKKLGLITNVCKEVSYVYSLSFAYLLSFINPMISSLVPVGTLEKSKTYVAGVLLLISYV